MNGTRIDCIADTSAIINLSRRHPPAIAVMGDLNFIITFITVAELQLGIRKATHWKAALQRIEAVLRGRQVLYPSAITPLVYADVCQGLEAEGLRIPSNDMWIAALAIEHDLPVVARDEHFTRVQGLKYVSF